jgi:hypothetical protein
VTSPSELIHVTDDVFFYPYKKSIYLVAWVTCGHCSLRKHAAVRIPRKLLAIPKPKKTKQRK